MVRELTLLSILGSFLTLSAGPQSVPIYRLTVVERTVKAVSYQYRTGPTPIDFRGTVLLPEAKGDAVVESKSGRTAIDAHFSHLPAPNRFGGEYLTYVLWAITPEGHPKNLGEIVPGSSDKAHTQVTTDMQAFGMIVTAEPYAAVRQPSDVVVMENEVRPDTVGSVKPVQVRYELMPRHGYTYDKTKAAAAAENPGPTVSMGEYETLLELYQAQNAVQIAESSGAGQYAADVLSKAQTQLQSAQALHNQKADKSLVIAAAREASQTAEDARALADKRSSDAAVASARSEAERERQLRLAAEAQAQQATQQALEAKQQAQQAQAEASADRIQLEQMAQTPTQQAQTAPVQTQPAQTPVTTSPAAIDYSKISPPPPEQPDDRGKRELRISLAQQLRGLFPLTDSPRGLVETVGSLDFEGTAPDGTAAVKLSQIAALVSSHPGLTIEVDGHSDSASPEAEHIAAARAEAVREELVRAGVAPSLVTVRDMGNARPLGPNTTAQGRDANRRTEIVISGPPIGNLAAWDKSYPLVPR